MTEKTRNNKENKHNEPKEFILNAALGLLEIYFQEKIFFELALDNALIPKATGPFIDAANTRVKKTIRELEDLLRQYKQHPPTQNGGKQ